VLARTFIRLTTTVIVVAVALMLAFPFFLSLQAVATCGSANAKIDSCFGHRFVPHGNKKPRSWQGQVPEIRQAGQRKSHAV
jgi:hypothetical protein